jgi:hypothetical protein
MIRKVFDIELSGPLYSKRCQILEVTYGSNLNLESKSSQILLSTNEVNINMDNYIY